MIPSSPENECYRETPEQSEPPDAPYLLLVGKNFKNSKLFIIRANFRAKFRANFRAKICAKICAKFRANFHANFRANLGSLRLFIVCAKFRANFHANLESLRHFIIRANFRANSTRILMKLGPYGAMK